VRLVVRTPATIANLGPGFDCLGLALGLANETVLASPDDPSWAASDEVVRIEGEGAGELPGDRSNLITRVIDEVARRAGVPALPYGLTCRNGIPLERGLGSSAAAVVAGVLVADRAHGLRLSTDELLTLAAGLEGHADNVAACLFGGLTVAYRTPAGWRAVRLDTAPALVPVVLVPSGARTATHQARAVLPHVVPLEAAVHTLGRAALAVVALTSHPELLADALDDRLHEPARLGLAPESAALLARLREAGTPACLAGSGPSLLAFESPGSPVPDPGPGWSTLRPGIDRRGAIVGEQTDAGSNPSPDEEDGPRDSLAR
jgi:homoserine kinase